MNKCNLKFLIQLVIEYVLWYGIECALLMSEGVTLFKIRTNL